MPATDTDNRTTKQLKKQLAKQNESIANMLMRISGSSLRNELGRFKSDVANDVKYLTDRVDG